MTYRSELKRPIIYWQYKNAPRFSSVLNDFIDLLLKFYPCEMWELFDIDSATGYALDIIGSYLGVPRPKDDPSSAGIYDVAEYENSYYDYSSKDIDLVKDDVYRYMLKLKIMIYQPWRPSSVDVYYNALEFAFPGKKFMIYQRPGTNIVDLHAYSYMSYAERRALFSDVMVAPMGRTLLITYDYAANRQLFNKLDDISGEGVNRITQEN